jgi:hypothetical protein
MGPVLASTVRNARVLGSVRLEAGRATRLRLTVGSSQPIKAHEFPGAERLKDSRSRDVLSTLGAQESGQTRTPFARGSPEAPHASALLLTDQWQSRGRGVTTTKSTAS